MTAEARVNFTPTPAGIVAMMPASSAREATLGHCDNCDVDSCDSGGNDPSCDSGCVCDSGGDSGDCYGGDNEGRSTR